MNLSFLGIVGRFTDLVILCCVFYAPNVLLAQTCPTSIIDYKSAGGGKYCIEFDSDPGVASIVYQGVTLNRVGTTNEYSTNNFSCSGQTVPGTVVVEIGSLICTYSNGALPITLVRFEGIRSDSGFQLKWRTASEEGNDYFSVERSSDGFTFKSIGIVKGTGYASEFSDYEFVDRSPIFGANYYRLTQFDFDGSSSSSEVIFYRHTMASDLQLKVDSKQLYIYTDGLIYHVATVSLDGRLLLASDVSSGNKVLDLSSLPSGIYAVKVISSVGTMVSKFHLK